MTPAVGEPAEPAESVERRFTEEPILLLHSEFGVRPAITETAVQLKSWGFDPSVLDLFGGRSADQAAEAQALSDEWDKETLGYYVRAEIERLADDHGMKPIVVGFSWGASAALRAVLDGAPARAVVLLHGVEAVPTGSHLPLPVMIQVAESDPELPAEQVQDTARELMAAGASVQLRWQSATSHLFTDSGLPDWDASAAASAWEQVQKFLFATREERIP